MFEELIETQPDTKSGANRKSYFIVTSLLLFVSLSAAMVFSLFAVNLSLDLNDMDMVELIAPVDTQAEQKLPELETAPKPEAKPKPGPAAAPVVTTRQANIASINESPTAVPTTVSTVASTQKARPADRYFVVGEFDNDAGSTGVAGRGPGGDGTDTSGLATGDEVVAKVEKEEVPPPPPVRKIEEKPVIRSLGVVNGRATNLPMPAVPSAAKMVNAAGTVSVQVLIDEKGNVVSASAVSGNQMLRATSEAAAKQAKFIPTLLSGEPVKASGIINYHFS